MVLTTTPVFLWSLINLGPVTQTFTAAPSCATKTDGVMIASKLPSNETILVANYPERCGKVIQVGDCMPLGDKRDEYFKNKDPLQFDTQNYLKNWIYSPGLFCPSGWTTVGAMTKGADGKIASPEGYFVPEPTRNLSSELARNMIVPFATALATAIEPGETAAACCPEGWSVVGLGDCYSPLPADKFPGTAGCATRPVETGGFYATVTTTIEVGGIPSTPVELISPTYTGKGSIITTTWTGTTASEHFAVTVMPAVILVHKSEDAAKTTGGGGGSGTGGGSSGTGTNAAVAMRPGGPDAKALGGLALVVMTAVMAGAAVMMPW